MRTGKDIRVPASPIIASDPIRVFLEALFGSKPDELYVLVWTLSDKRSRWFRHVEEAVRYVTTLAGEDIYVGVGLSAADFGPVHRCTSEKVMCIVGLWADLDLKSEAHAKSALPATVEDALSILPPILPPTFVILTGHGAHAWWLFREPLIFGSHEERAAAAKLANRWQTLLRLNAANRGWAFDRLADLARVLRIPGTVNKKDPQHPKPVVIHSDSGRRYNPSDFEEFLDNAQVPDPNAQQRATAALAEQFEEKPLVINPNASMPEVVLNRLLEASARFRNTWNRQRPDLKDQSQSGYDLALANLGFQAGMTEQQIVDMIVHHRRLHSQRPRSRLDYFQRTLGKAARAHDGSNGTGPPPSGLPEALGLTDANKSAESNAVPDPAMVKAILCDQISGVLGVRIVRIVKITGKDPTYQVELERNKVELSSVSKLVDQRSLRLAIAGSANHLTPKIKPRQWEQIAQAMLDALTIVDGGEETDLAGSMRIYLDHYLSETSFVDAIENEPIQTQRKPTVYEGRIAISSIDLQQYINKTFNLNLAIKDVTSMLTALGGSSTRVKGSRLRDQCRWLLPVSEFASSDYTDRGKEKSYGGPS